MKRLPAVPYSDRQAIYQNVGALLGLARKANRRAALACYQASELTLTYHPSAGVADFERYFSRNLAREALKDEALPTPIRSAWVLVWNAVETDKPAVVLIRRALWAIKKTRQPHLSDLNQMFKRHLL